MTGVQQVVGKEGPLVARSRLSRCAGLGLTATQPSPGSPGELPSPQVGDVPGALSLLNPPAGECGPAAGAARMRPGPPRWSARGALAQGHRVVHKALQVFRHGSQDPGVVGGWVVLQQGADRLLAVTQTRRARSWRLRPAPRTGSPPAPGSSRAYTTKAAPWGSPKQPAHGSARTCVSGVGGWGKGRKEAGAGRGGPDDIPRCSGPGSESCPVQSQSRSGCVPGPAPSCRSAGSGGTTWGQFLASRGLSSGTFGILLKYPDAGAAGRWVAVS